MSAGVPVECLGLQCGKPNQALIYASCASLCDMKHVVGKNELDFFIKPRCTVLPLCFCLTPILNIKLFRVLDE